MAFEKRILVSAYNAVRLFSTSSEAKLDDLERVKVQYMNKAINRVDEPESPLDVRDKDGVQSKTDLIAYYKAGKLPENHEVWTNANQFTKSEHLLSTIGKQNKIYTILVPIDKPIPHISLGNHSQKPDENSKSKPKSTPHKVTITAQNSISNFVAGLKPGSETNTTTMEDRMMSRMEAMIDKSTHMLGTVLNKKFDDFWTDEKENKIIDKIGQSNQLAMMIDEKIDEAMDQTIDEKIENQLASFEHTKLEERILELENIIKAKVTHFESQITSLTDKTQENRIHLNNQVTSLEAKLSTKAEIRVLNATAMAGEFVEHQQIAAEYRKKIATTLNNGQIVINIVDDNLYEMKKKDPEDHTSTEIPVPDINKIQLILKRKITQIEDASLGLKKNKPVFKAKVGSDINSRSRFRPTFSEINTATRALLLNRKEYKGQLGISIDSKDTTNFNVYLNNLVRDEISVDYTTSRLGRLVVFINDGDTEIKYNEPHFNEELFAEYVDTCTRLMPESPALLAKLDNPTVTKLRALARRTHFVGPEFKNLIKYPAGGNEKRYATQDISEFFDDVDAELESLMLDTTDLLGAHPKNDQRNGQQEEEEVHEKESSVWDDGDD